MLEAFAFFLPWASFFLWCLAFFAVLPAGVAAGAASAARSGPAEAASKNRAAVEAMIFFMVLLLNGMATVWLLAFCTVRLYVYKTDNSFL